MQRARENVLTTERDALYERLQLIERDNRDLRDELALATTLCDRLSSLLVGVAVALKGPQAMLQRHGFNDLPQLAEALKAELAELKAKQ
jgi:hypothetical protein